MSGMRQEEKLRALAAEHGAARDLAGVCAEKLDGGFSKSQMRGHLRRLGLSAPRVPVSIGTFHRTLFQRISRAV